MSDGDVNTCLKVGLRGLGILMPALFLLISAALIWR